MVGRGPEQALEEGWLVQAAWRVVGAVESPLRNPELSNLVDGVLRSLFEQASLSGIERRRVREAVLAWYETHDGRPVLAQDARGELDDLILRGAAQHLLEGESDPANETLFWAIGTVDVETAAEIIRSVWCPKQV